LLTPVRSGLTILVVDDEPALREITGRILESAGFSVKFAEDGVGALELIRSEGPPDLVLTDLTMPGMGGAELARRLGEHWPELPILLVSGSTADEVRQDQHDEAATVTIQKPFTADELVQKVGDALR
jgi:CheY-like chemotaxis protein